MIHWNEDQLVNRCVWRLHICVYWWWFCWLAAYSYIGKCVNVLLFWFDSVRMWDGALQKKHIEHFNSSSIIIIIGQINVTDWHCAHRLARKRWYVCVKVASNSDWLLAIHKQHKWKKNANGDTIQSLIKFLYLFKRSFVLIMNHWIFLQHFFGSRIDLRRFKIQF